MITAGEFIEKVAFSITDDGHKLDSKTYQAASDYLNNVVKAEQEYRKSSPALAYIRKGVMSTFPEEVARNKMQHLAAMHAKKENSYNPFAGLTDKSYEENKKQMKKLKNKG